MNAGVEGQHGEPGGIDPRRAWHALRRRLALATTVGLALAVVSAVPTWLLVPHGYEAVAWLRVRDKAGMLSTAGRDGAEYEAYRKTQVQLIKSPFVLSSALRRPGVADCNALRDEPDPVGWLESSITVTAPPHSEVLQIGLRGERPSETALIVNAVTQSYLDDIVSQERRERLRRRDALEKKYKENMKELRSRHETFNSLARSLGTGDSQEVLTQRGIFLDKLGSLRMQMSQTEQEIAGIDAELAILQARASGSIDAGEPVAEELVAAALARDPRIEELSERLAALDESIALQHRRSTRGHDEPAVQRLHRQREELTRLIDKQSTVIRPQVVAQILLDGAGRGGRPVESVAALAMRRGTLARSLDETGRQYDTLAEKVTALGQANAELEGHKAEIEQLDRITRQIGTELEATAIDLQMPSRVTLIEEAGVPESSDRLTRLVFTLVAASLGMTGGMAAVVAVEYVQDRLAAPDDLAGRLGVRVLGTLPLASRAAESATAIVAERMDAVRTLIAGPAGPQVILVTSAMQHEGTTTVATQLAASLARSGRRTLLIDGDLRQPSIHTALGLELVPGFAELLRGEVTPGVAVRPMAVNGLWAITGGRCDYEAITALSRPDAAGMVEQLRMDFDQIVIDAGPVLAFADALLLGRQSDAVVLATMRDVSRMPHVADAIERLRSVGGKLVGVVVNGVHAALPRQPVAISLAS
jgi:succinoglycan biosynthesis transport protein ExoP